MHHAVFTGDRQIEIRQGQEPVAAPGEVIVDVLGCALCGSDLRVWRDGWPVTPGHEIIGRVASGHRRGERVLVYIPVFCGTCDDCRRDDTHLCLTHGSLIGWQRNGGYAERLAVPEQSLIPVPDDIETRVAPLLLDVVGTPAHGLRLAHRVTPKGSIAIIGAGPIGLGALLAAQNAGHRDVFVTEPGERRLSTALGLGAALLDPQHRYDIVLESSGTNAGRQQALEITAAHGVYVFLGESPRWDIEETRAIRRKDFFIARSFYFPLWEVTDNLAILRADKTRYAALVDETAPLAGLAGLFERFSAGQTLKPLCLPS
jgi:threonine dehydrogenase-like Zn-dependent dehydrogenase